MNDGFGPVQREGYDAIRLFRVPLGGRRCVTISFMKIWFLGYQYIKGTDTLICVIPFIGILVRL